MSTGRERREAVSRIGPDAGAADLGGVRLAPLSLQHAEATVAWLEDPEVARGLGLRREPTIENTKAWIEHAAADPHCHPFAVLAGDGHVGNVVLDQVDEYLSTARLSIYLGQRDGGIGQQAVRQAAEHATEALHLHKLWLTVHVGNAPALAAYARCGFAVEGILREEFLLDGERTDLVRMGLLLGRPALPSR